MKIEITLFGQLTDITGSDTIVLDDMPDTNGLVLAINKLFPSMIAAKYIIAVDKKIVNSNTAISRTSNVALLPPFSGG